MERDDWGQDPSVKAMRRIFKAMERRQEHLLQQLDISLLDPRLRQWREKVLDIFESAWMRARQQGILMDEEKAGTLYGAGWLKILQREGMADMKRFADAGIEMLFKEDGL